MADPIRELVIKVSVEADEKPLESIGETSDKTRTRAVALGNVIGSVVVKLGEMAAAALRAGAAMAKDLVFGTAEAADRIAKLGDRLNVNTTQLQRMQGALELSGGSASDLASGIRDLEKNLGEAITKGTGPGIEGLAALGLELAEVDSFLAEGDLEGALGLIGDAANSLGDDLVKQSALLKLFGGAGAALEPLLDAGSDGVRELGDRISATGEVIDEEALASFAAMQDNLRDIEGRVQGAKNAIAGALAPAVSVIADRVEDWSDQNRDFIEQDLPAILEGLGEVLIDVAEFTIDLVTSWREFIRDASDLAEILAEDVDPALDVVGDGLATVENIISGLSLALADLIVNFLEAVGAGEELIQIFREVRSELTGEGATQGQRGAPGFLGGGSALVNQADHDQADASGDTTKLRKIAADPRFSDGDRQAAAASADRIDAREAAKDQAEANRRRDERLAAIKASRARIAETGAAFSARTRSRPSARGGSGGARPSEPTIEDLIGQAVGGASPAALRSATSALSGTLLVTEDNRIQITIAAGAVDVGGIEVAAEIPARIGAATAAEIDERVVTVLAAQIRDVLETARARRTVGA